MPTLLGGNQHSVLPVKLKTSHPSVIWLIPPDGVRKDELVAVCAVLKSSGLGSPPTPFPATVVITGSGGRTYLRWRGWEGCITVQCCVKLVPFFESLVCKQKHSSVISNCFSLIVKQQVFQCFSFQIHHPVSLPFMCRHRIKICSLNRMLVGPQVNSTCHAHFSSKFQQVDSRSSMACYLTKMGVSRFETSSLKVEQWWERRLFQK